MKDVGAFTPDCEGEADRARNNGGVEREGHREVCVCVCV